MLFKPVSSSRFGDVLLARVIESVSAVQYVMIPTLHKNLLEIRIDVAPTDIVFGHVIPVELSTSHDVGDAVLSVCLRTKASPKTCQLLYYTYIP